MPRKVAIIGSGIGGAASAALLADRGFAVTLFERNDFAGGKSASYEREGFVCDMGVHMTARGSNGPLGEVARRVGADLKFAEPSPIMRIQTATRKVDLPPNFLGLNAIVKLALVAGVKPWNIPGAIRMFMQILRTKEERDAVPYDSVPLRDFLLRYTADKGLHRLLDLFSVLLFVVPNEEASAGEFLWSFASMAKARSLGYPVGGFGQIAKSYLRACEEKGGKVCLKEGVCSVRVEGGKAVGVVTEKGVYDADIIVSNAGIRKTIELAGEEHFPASYLAQAERLRDSLGGITVKYTLDQRPFDIPVVLYMPGDTDDCSQNMGMMSRGEVPDDFPIFMPCPTNCDPSLAPPGKHILLAGTVAPADLCASDLAENLLDRMEQKIFKLFPGIEKHIIWKHRTNLSFVDAMGGRGAGEVVGLAQSHDQVGENKPDPRTPVQGLYLVGCDAGGRGIGTEQAADSALKVSKMILSEAQTPRMVVAEAQVPR